MPDLTLTDDEVNATLVGLYERHDETKRYVYSTKRSIEAHDGHGEKCCCYSLDHQRETLAAFEKRLAAISSAIDKFEGIEP